MINKKVEPSKTMGKLRFFTVEDLVKILPLTKLGVRRYLRRNLIKAVKVGTRWFVSEKNLSDFLLCRTIRDMPDDRLVSTVNKMVELVFNEYVDNQLVPCIKDVIRELNENKQEVIPEKIAEHIKSGLQPKKVLEKVK